MQSAGPAAHRQPCLGDPPMQQIQLYMTHQLQGQLLGTPHLSSQVQELHRRLQARLSGMPAAMRVQSLMLWGGSVHKKWTGCSVFCSRGNPSRRCSWRHTAAYRSAPAAVHCMLPRIPLLCTFETKVACIQCFKFLFERERKCVCMTLWRQRTVAS